MALTYIMLLALDICITTNKKKTHGMFENVLLHFNSAINDIDKLFQIKWYNCLKDVFLNVLFCSNLVLCISKVFESLDILWW